MLQDVEVDAVEERPVLEIDPPAPTKPASLTGALVQRGRDRASHTPEPATGAPIPLMAAAVPEPIAAPEFADPSAPAQAEPSFEASTAPETDEVPLVFAPRDGAVLEGSPSRFSDALFVLACCGAFFATFLFALRF
jgi:hypothetical protein